MHDAEGQAHPPIGGFLTLALPGPGGMDRHWQIDPNLAWGNATSAFAALVAHLRPGTVWLPGYLCVPFLAAVPRGLRRFFATLPDGTPDTATLHGMRPGDLVLAVDYFGRPPAAAWRDFVVSQPGVTFVEDASQALDPGPAWGDWRLHSARKVLGVPEGGLLIPCSDRARGQALPGPDLPPDPGRVIERMLPMLARIEAPGLNRLWHPLNQVAEAGQLASGRAMSRFALGLLTSLDPAPAIAARKANFALLARALPDLALLPDTDPAYAPLGFPILLPAGQRASVQTHLAAHGIFAAVHWSEIAAPADFLAEHDRAARCLTLPCDPRYGPAEMDRIVETLREALP